MAIVLSDQDWDDLTWQKYEQNGEIIDSLDSSTSSNGLSPFRKAYNRIVHLQQGLHIQICEYQLTEDIICKSSSISDSNSSALSFFITGNVRTRLHGLTEEVEETVGKNDLECSVGCPETEEWYVGENILRVQICINSIYFNAFSKTELETLPIELRRSIEGNDMRPYYRQGTTTPAMKVALQQILHCPYQGASKRMYLESQALELMTLQFEQFLEFDSPKERSNALQLDDIERLYWAKEILIGNLHQPPSLIELAHQVGLNDYKLKQGFRQVFGKTVFGYLHDYRMEQAQHLLTTGQISIREAARSVGYTSQSAFAVAFKQKYGVNPKTFQKSIGTTFTPTPQPNK
jgi:AraC family transcriptional regulator, transcriptional activator of the genes for pyochelin and ferripyochelin receptors